jgi:hypothetical protein
MRVVGRQRKMMEFESTVGGSSRLRVGLIERIFDQTPEKNKLVSHALI